MDGTHSWKDPETYMLVWQLTGDDGKVKHGLYMYDETTIKTFGNADEARIARIELINSMKQFRCPISVRIVMVVNW